MRVYIRYIYIYMSIYICITDITYVYISICRYLFGDPPILGDRQYGGNRQWFFFPKHDHPRMGIQWIKSHGLTTMEWRWG